MSGVLTLNFCISFWSTRWTKPYRRGWQAKAGRMAGLLAEMIGSIATVRSFGGEPAVKQRYDETQEEWKVQRGLLHKIQWRSSLALSVLNTFAVFLAVAVTARGALSGQFSPGDILLVLTLSQSLISTVGPIARQINQTADIDTAAERLVELLDVDAEIADRADAVDLDGDQILVLQGGRVVEHGRHTALAARTGGLYAHLFALQTNGRFGAEAMA